MLVRYLGPHDAVDVDLEPPVHVERGGEFEVADDIGHNLTAQRDFEAVAKPAKKES